MTIPRQWAFRSNYRSPYETDFTLEVPVSISYDKPTELFTIAFHNTSVKLTWLRLGCRESLR